MDFWNNVKFLLEQKNITLKELAADCSISYSSFCNAITRQTLPSLESAFRISKRLNVSIEYLLTGQSTSVSPTEIESLRKAAQELKDLKAKLKELAQ